MYNWPTRPDSGKADDDYGTFLLLLMDYCCWWWCGGGVMLNRGHVHWALNLQ
jgi:hypothetical protein